MMRITDENRSFGLLMGGVLLAFAAARFIIGGAVSLWLIGPALLFLAAAAGVPAALAPVRRLWMRFAHVLGIVNSRILLTVVFALIVTPTALVLRWLGRRPMALRPHPDAASYWRKRTPDEFTAARLERQF